MVATWLTDKTPENLITPLLRLANRIRALIDKVCLRRLDISRNLGIRVGGFCLYSCGFNRQAQKICQS